MCHVVLLHSGIEVPLPDAIKNVVDQLRQHSNTLDDATSTSVPDVDFRAKLQDIDSIY